MTDIVVLGSANMDLVVRQPRLPRPGETMFGSDFSTIPGGKGLNQAVAASRGGASVAFAGAVGDDGYGRELLELMSAEGIATDAVDTVPAPTGTAHISVLDGGENSIVVVSGANVASAELSDAARAAIVGARFLLMQFERPQSLLLEGARAAREAGVVTILTPAPVADPLDDLLELIDILVPNEREACELAGIDDSDAAALALSGLVGTVVVTRGERGALVARAGRIVAEIPARAVDAVDTTAAGDTFVGVLAARLAAGDDLDAALAAASVAASISVTRPGATTSMPTWEEIEGYLAG